MRRILHVHAKWKKYMRENILEDLHFQHVYFFYYFFIYLTVVNVWFSYLVNLAHLVILVYFKAEFICQRVINIWPSIGFRLNQNAYFRFRKQNQNSEFSEKFRKYYCFFFFLLKNFWKHSQILIFSSDLVGFQY